MITANARSRRWCTCCPLLDSLKYSKFLLLQFPAFSLALLPLSPLISLWFNLGFLQIAVFFATYLGVVQNQNMKRFVAIQPRNKRCCWIFC